MDKSNIIPGFVASFLEDDVYDKIEKTVNEHNDNATVGDKYWYILIENNNCTVCEGKEVPEPQKPSIENIRKEKLMEMSDICQRTIYAGTDVELSSGQEHFSFEIADQSNIDGIFNAVMLGAIEYPYHADGKPCKMYDAKDIITLYVSYKGFVTQQTTYCNSLYQWIKRETDSEILNNIQYGSALPDDLNEEMQEILLASNNQVQRIISKLTILESESE